MWYQYALESLARETAHGLASKPTQDTSEEPAETPKKMVRPAPIVRRIVTARTRI